MDKFDTGSDCRVMAPLRSYIMQLLIDSKSYKELLEKCLIAAVFSVAVFIFEWISKKRQAVVVRDMERDLRDQVMCKLFYISANQFEKKGLAYYLSKFTTDIRIILDDASCRELLWQGCFFAMPAYGG